MQRWSYAIIAAVVAGGLLGARVPDERFHAPVVRFHVRTAHCHIAGSTSPMQVKMVCG